MLSALLLQLPEAIRSEKYRNRMKKAASMQVVKRKYGNNLSERMMDMADVYFRFPTDDYTNGDC